MLLKMLFKARGKPITLKAKCNRMEESITNQLRVSTPNMEK